jgi:hypothetical protein
MDHVPSGGDVSIVAVGTTRDKPTLETFYNGFDGWGWGGFGDAVATTTVEHYKEGKLVLDMFDTNTKKLIWRGSATEILSDKPEKNIDKLQKAVQLCRRCSSTSRRNQRVPEDVRT